MSLLREWLCRWRGHRDRRLRVGERGDGSDRKLQRICDRCSRIRAVKGRKRAGEEGK